MQSSPSQQPGRSKSQDELQRYEQKAQQVFGEVCVNKVLVQQAGFGTRSIPAFVSEWIVTRNAPDGVLKDYLESGSFARGGTQKIEAGAGLVLLANIPLDEDKHPLNDNLFAELPAFLGETAFIDRMHGILPGWELPRIQQSFIATGMGFKADYFGDVLHHLRSRAGYEHLVQQHNTGTGTNDRRDITAISRLATGFCKLLFPHATMSAGDFREYCLKPAVLQRQRVRDQLCLLDPEYERVRMGW